MVHDKIGKRYILRYLVHDVIMYDGQDVKKLPFHPGRHDILQQKIIAPRIKALKERRLIRELEPFSIRMKESWDITISQKLLQDKFRNNLSHELKGLVFIPSNETYSKETDILKWTSSLKTVHFLLKIETIMQRKIACLYVNELQESYTTIKFTEDLEAFDNTIVECKYDKSQWTIIRQRADKSLSSSLKNVQAVRNSSNSELITQKKLLAYIDQYCSSNAFMPQQKKRKCI